jgi:hypothetical protein
MKASRYCLAIAWFLALSSLLQAAEKPLVSISVDPESKTERPTGPKGHGRPPAGMSGTKTQTKSLKITLTNLSDQALTHLSVKYYFVGRNADEHESSVLNEGEKFSDLAIKGKDLIETPEFTATLTKTPPPLGGRGSAKKPTAVGSKITGYGVQVFNGGTLVGEYYNLPEVKTAINPKDKPDKK